MRRNEMHIKEVTGWTGFSIRWRKWQEWCSRCGKCWEHEERTHKFETSTLEELSFLPGKASKIYSSWRKKKPGATPRRSLLPQPTTTQINTARLCVRGESKLVLGFCTSLHWHTIMHAVENAQLWREYHLIRHLKKSWPTSIHFDIQKVYSLNGNGVSGKKHCLIWPDWSIFS